MLNRWNFLKTGFYEGIRLAIIALELDDGSLIATEVSLTSDEAVTTTTFTGVVTETGDGVATITDDEGNSITVEIPEGIELVLGDLVTVFLTSGGDGEEPTVTDIAFSDDVVDRLLGELETSTGAVLEELERLLEENGDEQVTRLANALDLATDQAKFNLETALDNATSRLEQVFEGAGINGPFVRVEGFIIALAVDEPTTGDGQGPGIIDIGLIDDSDISLVIVEKTKITDPVEVGDFVEVRYNLALVAKSIDLASDELTFKGTIATLSETDLVFEDGTSFVINEGTDVDDPLSSGDKVTVEALPTEGQLVALEVKLTDDKKGKSKKKDATGDIELKGIITALSTADLEVDGLLVLLTDDTNIEGELALGVFVEVQGTIEEGAIVATDIEVTEARDEKGRKGKDKDGSDLEFEGTIASLSETQIVLDDGTIILIDDDTEVEGTLEVGTEVEVDANISEEGTLVGVKIEVKVDKKGKPDKDEADLDFEGTIASFSDTQIELEDGTIILIDEDTSIDGTLEVGAEVQGTTLTTEEGEIVGVDIEVVEDKDKGGGKPDKDEADLDFEGIIASFSDTQIELEDGTIILIDEDTEIDGTLEIGAEVQGTTITTEEGAIVGVEIEVVEDKDKGGGKPDKDKSDLDFDGAIASFSDTQIVLEDGTIILIDEDTSIDGTLEVGAEVQGTTRTTEDGDIVGVDIEVVEDKGGGKPDKDKDEGDEEEGSEEEEEEDKGGGKPDKDDDDDKGGGKPDKDDDDDKGGGKPDK